MMPKGVEHRGVSRASFGFVLNAFRHHRNSHCTTSARFMEGILVLNAFRHHRNSHTAGVPPASSSSFLCSTPFGIIGILTPFDRYKTHSSLSCATPFCI